MRLSTPDSMNYKEQYLQKLKEYQNISEDDDEAVCEMLDVLDDLWLHLTEEEILEVNEQKSTPLH
jgi:hypothetical protein